MGREPSESNPADVWGVVSDPESGRAPFAVRILKENHHVKTIRLEPDVTYIGRMPENHVVLDDAKSSRSHARIFKKGDSYVIEDQESENGTYVNGKRIKEYPLKPGLLIGIGSHVLEVVRALVEDREASRERQLDQAEEEEWRMDQTLSGTPEQLAKLVASHPGEKKDSKPKAGAAPKMSFQLQVGNRRVEKSFDITQARNRKEGDPAGDEVEIRVYLGKWVLFKKVPL